MTAITWTLVASMFAVSAFCAGRMVVARWTGRMAEVDSDVLHVVMGVAMAGMLVASLRFAPDALWIGVFLLGATWFGWQLIRPTRTGWACANPAPHLLESGAMVYMAAALRKTAAPMSMSGPASRLSFVPLLIALCLIVYVVRLADRPVLVGAGQAAVLAPRCSTACKLAMGVTMSYMLVMML
jgi:hypothetical protein